MGLPRHFRVPSLTVDRLLTDRPSSVCSVAPGTSVSEALASMTKNNVSAIAVFDGANVSGVFSGCEQLRSALPGCLVDEAASVCQVMTACSVHAEPHLDVFACLTLMKKHRLQYIPVVDRGSLLGLISLSDLQAAVIDQYERVFQELELDLKILFLQGTYSC